MPPTIKDNSSKVRTSQKVLCNKTPVLTTNKRKVGRTFGVSGMFSLEMASPTLTHQKILPVLYVEHNK